MRVTIMRKRKLLNIILPEAVEGNYWIPSTDENGIKRNLMSIEAEDGRWKLISNNDASYITNNEIQPYAYLSEGNYYSIRKEKTKEIYKIFCSSTLINYNFYNINEYLKNGITIGSNEQSLIKYKFLDDINAIIKEENGLIFIEDNNSKYGIYVNDAKVNGRTILKTGDVIFSFGLRMVFIINYINKSVNYYLGVDDKPENIKLQISDIGMNLNSDFVEDENEFEFKMYEDSDYFHKMPRFVYQIKPLNLQVDAPPAKTEEQGNNILLTVGPMLTMSMTSIVTGYTSISGVINGTSDWQRAMPSLIICGAMVVSVFVWPLFTRWYEKRMRIKNEKSRQEKYKKYIDEKRNKIIEAKKEQSNVLINNFPSIKYCEETILKRYTTLWQKRITDEDFLEVSLGIGNTDMKIDIKYPEEHFSMVEDNLKEMVLQLGQEPKLLTNVPIPFSIIKNYIFGIVGDESVRAEFMRKILLQILAYHSYDDVKIVLATSDDNEYQWKFLKDIPHIFSDDKSVRFYTTNNDEHKEVFYYLQQILNERKNANNGDNNKIEKHYVVITDCIKNIRDFEFINSILNADKYYGFSLFVMDDKIVDLPDQCKSFVTLNKGDGELNEVLNVKEPIKFNFEYETYIDYEKCSKILSNIPIDIQTSEEGQLPDKVEFLEMFDVGKIEQLNVNRRWKISNPINTLQTPVGFGKNNEKIIIDLHEKFHGPHGLIAGMTGSGKSEFIISYILSMAINYDPREVQFILIDYKGGGLAGAFENKATGLKLPHLVGTITNLDANEIKRSLASIESELKRRQALFNKARELSGESTIDIYKYQKLFREKVVDEPISHLFIISDEFAELKNQQPEFMEQLISTARIGRSLGVHLILATQKPSGVVDPQIWSNTRFRVCLKVQDKSDSNEVIKCPDAAYLKQTGRFYFQVGFNEYFILGQAAWAGANYVPKEKLLKELDTSIEVIDNLGNVVKKEELKIKKDLQTASNGEQLVNIVKYISDIANAENIKCRPLWLEKIPADIRIEELAKKYNYQKESNILNPIIGEYDIPTNQEQKLLTVPISKDGNVIVYGASGSGKENFITSLIYSSMLYYTPTEVNYYIIDFGSGALKVFEKSPIIGDIINNDDEEKIRNLFKMISKVVSERKRLFSDYNGDYLSYCKNSGKVVPNIIVIINNYELYQETYNQFDDLLVTFTRDCQKYGIYFIFTISTANGIRFKLKQNFSLEYVLQQNNPDDYTAILGNVSKIYPAKIFGRGIFKNDGIYEFQTALVSEKDNIQKQVKQMCELLSQKYQIKAIPVPTLPEIVGFNDISSKYNKSDNIIIGIEKDTLDVCDFNFNRNLCTIITGQDLEIMENFINNFVNQIIALNKEKLIIINSEEIELNDTYKKFYDYYDSDYNKVFEKLYELSKNIKEKYENNNYDKEIFKNVKKMTCILIGLESFKNKLNLENKNLFEEVFNNLNDLDVIQFIFIDSLDGIKKSELESWFKNNVNLSDGIWIGNGINDQFTLKINQKIPEMRENVEDGFCFVVNKGKIKYVKYVENFELKIKE